ncbi:MAG: hypothetical protein GTO18_17795 [Anaerolineales bacterium]|nr:hypothetical protein [Anaerolineales bacterium]
MPHQPRFLRKHYAIPSEHGSWIWWIGPFLIGAAAGGSPTPALILFFIAALAAFLSRQPTTIVVKVWSGRRPKSDLGPALFWTALYSLVALVSITILAILGYGRILLLAVPGIPVFLWHLWLVSRRQERGQQGIEIVGCGVLALTAPGAYWLSGGESVSEAAILWLLLWLQSAASIVFVYLRLEQRKLDESPPTRSRLRMGRRTLFYYVFNFLLSIILTAFKLVPVGVPLAFVLMLLDAVEGVLNPPVGAKPQSIGFRQLGASILFVIVMVLAYRV